MVSAAWSATGRESALGIFARWLGRTLRHRGAQVRTVLAVALRFVIILAGFGAITAGVWVGVGLAWGLVVGGVSLLVLEWIVKRQ